MKTMKEVVAGFSLERQKKIADRAARLIAEEMTLRDIRRAHTRTQASIAKALNITQDGVSRLEQRSDVLISTLRGYVEAMGGNLSLVAEFPESNPVVISGFGDIGTRNEPVRPGKRPRRRTPVRGLSKRRSRRLLPR